jgi:hypothetical protein
MRPVSGTARPLRRFMRTTTIRKMKASSKIEEAHEDHHGQEDESDEDQVAQRFT